MEENAANIQKQKELQKSPTAVKEKPQQINNSIGSFLPTKQILYDENNDMI